MFLTLALVFIITVLFCFNYKKHKYWKDHNVPTPPFLPIFGHILPLISGRSPFGIWLQDLYNSVNGRYVGVYRFSEPGLIIKDLDLYKQIFVKDFDHFIDHQDLHLSEDLDPIFANSLIFLRGQKWKDMRSTLSPAFTGSKMRQMFILMSETAQQLITYLSNEASKDELLTIDMKNILTRYTTDVVANCAFGIKCDSLQNPNNYFYVKSMQAIKIRGFRMLKLMSYFFIPKIMEFFNVSIIEKDLQDYFKHIILDNMAYREKEGIVRIDMIHLLMEARKGRLQYEESIEEDTGFATAKEADLGQRNVKKDLTDAELIAQAFFFLSAGSEPTANSVSFLAYELALNPDVQAKLHQEIDEVNANLEGPITYEILIKMKYLDMVLCENLRKWPGALVQDRKCNKPYTIHPKDPSESSVHLEKGIIVIVSNYAFHRDPKFFENPDKFDPERFNDENKKKIIPFSYMPFGFGPRNCIGSRFALLEIKTLIYYLLSTFEIKTVKKTPIPLKMSKLEPVLNSETEIWLGLQKRKL